MAWAALSRWQEPHRLLSRRPPAQAGATVLQAPAPSLREALFRRQQPHNTALSKASDTIHLPSAKLAQPAAALGISAFRPDMGERLVRRHPLTGVLDRVADGRSSFSSRPMPGVWQ